MISTILVLLSIGLKKTGHRAVCQWSMIDGMQYGVATVRFATLTDNVASNAEVPVSYTCHEINKAEEDVWLVYPWENVSEY